MHCYPSLDRLMLEFWALLGPGGLVTPGEFASMIGGMKSCTECTDAAIAQAGLRPIVSSPLRLEHPAPKAGSRAPQKRWDQFSVSLVRFSRPCQRRRILIVPLAIS